MAKRMSVAGAATVATAALLGFAAPAWAGPPGNNGTVKIDGIPIDAGNDNDPHVSCGFSVEFFGYDTGTQHASITVTPVAPTGGGGNYTTGDDFTVANRTGGDQLDDSVTVTGDDLAAALNGVTPQAQQGYHLRLDVEVTGSQGSDDKSKVFWMAPCSSTASSGSGTTSTTTATGGTTPTTSGTTKPTTAGDTTTSTGSATGTATTGATTAGDTAAGDTTAGDTTATSAETNGALVATSPASATSTAAGTTGSTAAGGAFVAGPATETLAGSGGPATGSSGTPFAIAAPATTTSAASGSLPFTGADTVGLLGLGGTLIGSGWLITRRARARRSAE